METLLPTFDSAFSIDCVIFGFEAGELKVLLIERNQDPFKDWWALPGNLVEKDESVEDAATRILYELTGLRDMHMEQFHTFGAVNRHPQGRIITVAYYALIRIIGQKEVKPITEYAKKASWIAVNELPKLAFDHTEIFDTSIQKMRRRLNYQLLHLSYCPRNLP